MLSCKKPFRCDDKFLKTLPTLTTYSTLAHKHGTFMHLGSVNGKSWTKILLDYHNTPIARTCFRKFCISSHSIRKTFANTYFRNKGVFDRSTNVISSKRYLQFAVGYNVLDLGIRRKQRTVKASNPILHSGTLSVPILVHTREYKTKVTSGPLVHYEFTALKTCRSGIWL